MTLQTTRNLNKRTMGPKEEECDFAEFIDPRTISKEETRNRETSGKVWDLYLRLMIDGSCEGTGKVYQQRGKKVPSLYLAALFFLWVCGWLGGGGGGGGWLGGMVLVFCVGGKSARGRG